MGGVVGSPMEARIARTQGASVMKAMMRTSPPQCGHCNGRSSNTRASSMAQSKRAGERAERSAALGAVCLGDAGEAACRAQAVTCARKGEWGASTP